MIRRPGRHRHIGQGRVNAGGGNHKAPSIRKHSSHRTWLKELRTEVFGSLPITPPYPSHEYPNREGLSLRLHDVLAPATSISTASPSISFLILSSLSFNSQSTASTFNPHLSFFVLSSVTLFVTGRISPKPPIFILKGDAPSTPPYIPCRCCTPLYFMVISFPAAAALVTKATDIIPLFSIHVAETGNIYAIRPAPEIIFVLISVYFPTRPHAQ